MSTVFYLVYHLSSDLVINLVQNVALCGIIRIVPQMLGLPAEQICPGFYIDLNVSDFLLPSCVWSFNSFETFTLILQSCYFSILEGQNHNESTQFFFLSVKSFQKCEKAERRLHRSIASVSNMPHFLSLQLEEKLERAEI